MSDTFVIKLPDSLLWEQVEVTGGGEYRDPGTVKVVVKEKGRGGKLRTKFELYMNQDTKELLVEALKRS